MARFENPENHEATVTQTAPLEFVETETQQMMSVPADLSPRMVELARTIDHLPNDHEYVIILHKERRCWNVTISEPQKINVMELWK